MAERWQRLENHAKEKWKRRWEKRTSTLFSVIRSLYWSEERGEDRLRGGGKEAAPGFGPQLSGGLSSVPLATSWPGPSGDTSKGLIFPSVRNAHINACTHVQTGLWKMQKLMTSFPLLEADVPGRAWLWKRGLLTYKWHVDNNSPRCLHGNLKGEFTQGWIFTPTLPANEPGGIF